MAYYKLRLDVWPMNEFGTRMVPLPQQSAADSLSGAGR